MPQQQGEAGSERPEAADSARSRLVKDYFETTSASGLDAAAADYRTATAGLARGLGDWLDVAGMRVVDLGCGTGGLCWLARSRGASEVVGVNLSQGEIDYASPHVQAQFVCEDILSFLRGRAEASVDVVFALNILEHLERDELVDVLEQARRCLAPGGRLVAMVPNATSPYGSMTRYWDITHCTAFTPSSVMQLVRLCGYSAGEFREWGPVPHGLVSALRYAAWQLLRVAMRLRLLIETGGDKGRVYTADMIFRLVR